MKINIYITVVVTILNFSCNTKSSNPYIYQQPINVNDGLETGTLEEVNIKSLILKMP